MLETIFTPKPPRWGLRGDPHLWDELREALKDTDPATITDLSVRLRALYAERVGVPLTGDDQPVSVERFRSGGMSSGMISPRFWREQGIPLLVERFNQAGLGGGSATPEEDAPGEELWWSREQATFFAIPPATVLPEGPTRIWRLSGEGRSVDPEALAAFALSREEAGQRISEAMLKAPGTGRQRLLHFLTEARQQSGGEKVDLEAMLAGLEGILQGSGWLDRLRDLSTQLQNAADKTADPQQASAAQADLKASLGRLGEQMQALGARLQALNKEEPVS